MGAFLAALGKKVAERELDKKVLNKRSSSGGTDTSGSSPISMGGGTASIPGQDADANTNIRRKRSNGKDRG